VKAGVVRRRDVIPSPNIWQHPDVYEAENRGVDPEGVIEAAMGSIHDWCGQTVVDIGCGAGFHLPRFADSAAFVIGVEPHAPLVGRAGARTRPLRDRVEVRRGTAQALPVPNASVDVAQARWAYFFGPGCEPGLDNDATRSTFGRWFRRALPAYDPVAVERFWARQGWQRVPLDIRWQLPDRAAFEAVARIEFEPEIATAFLAEQGGLGVDYAVNLYWRRF
jgi:SAM-dependent methyltransferase